ncbi:MAG: hypothetical protein JSW58_11205 [Candidatus Latescibacterota bacterium]|nr:MAG: hypothetical protein JSW58_11205 [Candidatus Latescibacterota bacterium]
MKAGDRIRLKTLQIRTHFYGERLHESNSLTGTVVLLDEQLVHLKLAESQDTISVRRDSITWIEKSVGLKTRKGEGKFIGTVLGAVAGAGIGVAIAYAPRLSGSDECRPSRIGEPGCSGMAVVLGAIGLVAGAVGGNILGGTIGDGMEYEKWERIRWLQRDFGLQLRSPMGGSGLRVSLAVRF